MGGNDDVRLDRLWYCPFTMLVSGYIGQRDMLPDQSTMNTVDRTP
jgi:hypothetical protein